MAYEVQIKWGKYWGTEKKGFKTKAQARTFLLKHKQLQRWGLKRGSDAGPLRVKKYNARKK